MQDQRTVYGRVVTAALAETRSKFALAEALALDIPPARRGPTAEDETSVRGYLIEAREAIIAAGGEPRAVETLDKYRRTALWVSAGPGRNFAWVKDASYTAHSEARMAGLSYEDFAAKPKTVDAIRRDAGKAPAGTRETPEQVVQGWTPAQKVDVVRGLLQESEVAEQALVDDQTALNAVKARAKHTEKRVTEQRDNQRMRAPDLADASDLAETGNNMAHIATRLELLAEQVQRIPANRRSEFTREWADIKRIVGWVDSVLSGGDIDEGLSKLLNGGDQQ